MEKIDIERERNALLQSGKFEIVPELQAVIEQEGNYFAAPWHDYHIVGWRNYLELFWCGYVGVPKTSWLWGTHYDGIWSDLPKNYPEIKVHGGLTWSSEGMAEHGMEPERWYYGFDCMHCYDLAPLQCKAFGEGIVSKYFKPKYRTKDFVLNECLSLAKQLKRIEKQRRGRR